MSAIFERGLSRLLIDEEVGNTACTVCWLDRYYCDLFPLFIEVSVCHRYVIRYKEVHSFGSTNMIS